MDSFRADRQQLIYFSPIYFRVRALFAGLSGTIMSLKSVSDLFSKLLDLQPSHRRLLLISVDALILPLAVWLSFWLQHSHPFHPRFTVAGFWLLPSILLIGLPLYAFTGQYKGLSRYVGSRSLYQLTLRNFFLVLLIWAFGWLSGFPLPPRSSWVVAW